MLESIEEFNLDILKDYDEEVKVYYKLNAVTGQLLITNLSCRVDVFEEEAVYFVRAWEALMEKFKIPTTHHNYILYITQSFYSKLEKDNEFYYDVQNATNAVDFFIGYLKEAELARTKGKFKTLSDAIDDKLSIQIKNTYSGLPVTLSYPTATRVIIEHLYKSLRSSDVALHSVLNDYKSIPSLETLTEIKQNLQVDLDYPYRYYLIETIGLLKKYFDHYLSKELSRKQHLFIFELLYLFNFLQYSGVVGKTDGKDFKLMDGQNEGKFEPIVKIDISTKIAFIKGLIKNGVKRSNYRNSQVLSGEISS